MSHPSSSRKIPFFIGTVGLIRFGSYIRGMDFTTEIGRELQTAWKGLGGEPDLMPDPQTGTGMYEAFEKQGAKSDLLTIIGSWRDTTEDENVLKWLRAYNA